MNKKFLIYILLCLSVLFFVSAGFEDDLALCGDNVRCKFKLAAEYDDASACVGMSGVQLENCESYVVTENVLREEYEQNRDVSQSKSNKGVLILAILLGCFILLFWARRYYHILFLEKNADLIKKLKHRLDSGESEKSIIDDLKGRKFKAEKINLLLKELKK
ncbi:MAG: hypothetical protein ABIC91_04940 [Nanoarchaeota archaeon]|nr:hypothetical protein [Nanoarchaeota archaeon]